MDTSPTTDTPLNIVVVEDSATDFELLTLRLKAQGWAATFPRVETPEALRMPFKILKNSGFYPPEIAMFHERAALVAAVRACADPEEHKRLQQKLSELEQKLALRLEALRVHGNL